MSALFAGPLLSASAARAQGDENAGPGAAALETRALSSNVMGAVLSIDQEDIVLDLGSTKGAADGAIVELWRPFKLRHPVTGRTLTDRFRIGALRLIQVQRTLALARPEGPLTRAPAPGDVVVLAIAAAPSEAGPDKAPAPGTTRTPAKTRSTADNAGSASASTAGAATKTGGAATGTMTSENARGTSLDAEGRALCALFDSLQGEPIAKRIQRYEQFLKAHPNGAYARVLAEEADALRYLLAEGRESAARSSQTPNNVVFLPPSSALANEPLTIGVEIAAVAGAVLHVRHSGEVAYRSIPMRTAGQRYYRATVTAEQMLAPEVEYFIESVNARGAAAPAVATADAPLRLNVYEGPHVSSPSRPAASVAIFTDYADYNRLRGNDYAWQTEGYFGLRYADKGVRAIRSGFGVYRGMGGSVLELDSMGRKPRRVGLTYGYLEGEWAPSPVIGLVGRLAFGLTDEGVNGGGQFFLRLGNDRLTNLLLGGEVLGGIGTRGIAELQWNTLPRVPIVLRTEVTNQPAGTQGRRTTLPGEPVITSESAGDIGARAMVQVGYRIVPELTLALRTSYEGRTIQHAGPGAGAGVTYTW